MKVSQRRLRNSRLQHPAFEDRTTCATPVSRHAKPLFVLAFNRVYGLPSQRTGRRRHVCGDAMAWSEIFRNGLGLYSALVIGGIAMKRRANVGDRDHHADHRA
jgi:hypothetical protein